MKIDQESGPAMMEASSEPTWTRRSFLQSTLGGVLALHAAACDNVGFEEEKPFFDGPQIDEEAFIAFNALYYDVGVDAKTQLPYSSMSGEGSTGETDPVSIAFRLQYLIDQGSTASATIETMLDHLLGAQISGLPPRNYRNLLPRLAFTASETGIEPATHEYFVIHNAMLSARVAMAAQAFKATAIEDKALTFLAKQKEGYNELLSRSAGPFLPTVVDGGIRGIDEPALDLLFGGYYEGTAFVLSYFIGDTDFIADPQVGLDTWQAMIDVQNTFVAEHPASTSGAVAVTSPLARNGSGFQYFHPLLALHPDALHPSMRDALYNVLYSYLDAALYDRLPGIYSAGPNLGGDFLDDNGLNRLAARQRRQRSQETVVTMDALAAALRLFPEASEERQTLRGWISLYASLSGILSTHGHFSSIDKNGEIVRSLFTRQNGAMILMNSTAADHLDAFLVDHGKPGMRDLFGQVVLTYQGAPIQKIEATLPLPPKPEHLFT